MNKEELKNFHYNNQNEIQFEYGGQTHHYSMECLKDIICKYYNNIGNELKIYVKIEETVEKIKNKEDMQDVISDINEISKNLYDLPLYHEFIEMMALFNKTYDTCLLANTKIGDE